MQHLVKTIEEQKQSFVKHMIFFYSRLNQRSSPFVTVSISRKKQERKTIGLANL